MNFQSDIVQQNHIVRNHNIVFIENSMLTKLLIFYTIVHMKNLNMENTFILRRVWTIGSCTRADVVRAFNTGCSPALSAKLMASAVNRWPDHLEWHKRSGIYPKMHAARPALADASIILDLLAAGEPPQVTGLFEDDGIPFLHPLPRPSKALTNEATQVIFEAAIQKAPIRILYVGLRNNEIGRWRQIWPCAMEFTGMRWRLHAQDLDDKEGQFPIKVFVLSRIMQAERLCASESVMKLGFKRKELVKRKRLLKVHLNEKLTKDQETVIKNDLGINQEGKMYWPDYSIYEFRREYENVAPSKNIVWPVLTRVEVID